ncbi:outer membrane chaperone Skp [Marinicauda salina]|uniref:Outer membrane chaperone Skp n=1 Tax=Marinicauda salina TaxID=2135793 RepID=A0A2U2BTD1_9PROT|nr:OmpH family outer membrane protein [Marinicauda salina]PWE17240.1 outer membrane chaperone Skp [Marinicauda salina]
MQRTLNRSLTASLGLIAALAAWVALSAAAQAQQVLIMSEERILRESAVGQHIASELERIGGEIQAELEAAGQPIAQENEALNAETSALSQEAIQGRPDLMQRIQQLQQDAAAFEQTRRRRQQELVATERAAMQPVLQALQGILQQIVEERGANVLLDRSQIVYANDAVDVTDTAIERLNAQMQTTPVNRVRLPEQGQGQQQQ